VVYFQVADFERPIQAAGLQFRQIGREDFPPGALCARDEEVGKLKGLAGALQNNCEHWDFCAAASFVCIRRVSE
jgi:hypothetical protein